MGISFLLGWWKYSKTKSCWWLQTLNILKTTKLYILNQWTFNCLSCLSINYFFKKSIKDQEASVNTRHRQLWPQNQSCFHTVTGPPTSEYILSLPPVDTNTGCFCWWHETKSPNFFVSGILDSLPEWDYDDCLNLRHISEC